MSPPPLQLPRSLRPDPSAFQYRAGLFAGFAGDVRTKVAHRRFPTPAAKEAFLAKLRERARAVHAEDGGAPREELQRLMKFLTP